MHLPIPPVADREHSRYHGFSLSSVCWGYRDLFEGIIEGLFEKGAIGPERAAVTRTFFGLLKNADQSCYDHVLRRFLGAINPRTEWLLGAPSIFADVVELGREYAAAMPHHGVVFFALLGAGGLGDSPAEMRYCLSQARRLRTIDVDLSLSFLKGYRRLASRLDAREIDLYVETGLTSFRSHARAGTAFMEGILESSENTIQRLAQECRLQDVQPLLSALLRALAGRDMMLRPLSELDTDAVRERGSMCVCLGSNLYLPERVRTVNDRRANHGWYTLAATVTAALLAADSFCVVHGDPAFASCLDVVGSSPAAVNLYLLAEWWRGLKFCRESWPGSRRLLGTVVRSAYPDDSRSGNLQAWIRAVLLGTLDALPAPLAQFVSSVAESVNFLQTADAVTPAAVRALVSSCPELELGIGHPPGFIPDFVFPGTLDLPPRDRLVADLRAAANAVRTAGPDGGENDAENGDTSTTADLPPGAETKAQQGEDDVSPCHVYDEWSRDDNDYLRRHCHVQEIVGIPNPVSLPTDIAAEGRRLSRFFERIMPDSSRKEKRLQDGDSISEDRLLDYLVRRRNDPSPRVDFYERPRIVRRDLAVLVLLDVSGSTGEPVSHGETIIDVERRAAILFGHGLHTLGDRFSICGFNSNGRENCRFFVYKDFADTWGKTTMARVMGATAANSTRMGPALRHAGWRLEQVAARQRLILVVTDGRPMDTGYDSHTRYAQHDVRVACEENERAGIHTFAISTEENTIADMEIMFPRRRFAILPDIRCLPRILPMLYTRLTF